MLPTPAGVPFVATGQSTTTAPAGKFPPLFASKTWFTFTPPWKTFKGNPETVVDGAVVVEIAPNGTLPAVVVQSPELPRGIANSAVVWIPFSSYMKNRTIRLVYWTKSQVQNGHDEEIVNLANVGVNLFAS